MSLIKWHKKGQYYFGRGEVGHYQLQVFSPPKESGVSRMVAFRYISDNDIAKRKKYKVGAAKTIRRAKELLESFEKKSLRM